MFCESACPCKSPPTLRMMRQLTLILQSTHLAAVFVRDPPLNARVPHPLRQRFRALTTGVTNTTMKRSRLFQKTSESSSADT